MHVCFMSICPYPFILFFTKLYILLIIWIFFVDDIVPNEIKLMSDKRSVPLYLDLLKSGSEKKRDIRIVIVGKKGSGKTSLVRKLFGKKIEEVTSTNGIEIHRIRCNANTDDGIWNIYDGMTFKLYLFLILYNREVFKIYEWNNFPFCWPQGYRESEFLKLRLIICLIYYNECFYWWNGFLRLRGYFTIFN